MLCGNNFFLSLFDLGLSKRLCLKALKNKCPLAVQSIAKKSNEKKKLLEITVFFMECHFRQYLFYHNC